MASIMKNERNGGMSESNNDIDYNRHREEINVTSGIISNETKGGGGRK